MNKDNTVPHDGAPSTSFQEHDIDSDDLAHASKLHSARDVVTAASLPRMKKRSAAPRYMRLFLLAMVAVALLALVGGYGVFRAVSQPSRQTSTAFQIVHCPFMLGSGIVE